MLLARILVFSVLGSVGAIGGAALLLIFPDDVRKRLVPALVAYAAGTLLGAALLGMIPAAAGSAPVRSVSAAVLAGTILFFLLERLVLWRHAHEVGTTSRPAAPLILIGDAFHNFVDGVVIAAAFLTSVPLGVAAGLAVIAHYIAVADLLPGLHRRPTGGWGQFVLILAGIATIAAFHLR